MSSHDGVFARDHRSSSAMFSPSSVDKRAIVAEMEVARLKIELQQVCTARDEADDALVVLESQLRIARDVIQEQLRTIRAKESDLDDAKRALTELKDLCSTSIELDKAPSPEAAPPQPSAQYLQRHRSSSVFVGSVQSGLLQETVDRQKSDLERKDRQLLLAHRNLQRLREKYMELQRDKGLEPSSPVLELENSREHDELVDARHQLQRFEQQMALQQQQHEIELDQLQSQVRTADLQKRQLQTELREALQMTNTPSVDTRKLQQQLQQQAQVIASHVATIDELRSQLAQQQSDQSPTGEIVQEQLEEIERLQQQLFELQSAQATVTEPLNRTFENDAPASMREHLYEREHQLQQTVEVLNTKLKRQAQQMTSWQQQRGVAGSQPSLQVQHVIHQQQDQIRMQHEEIVRLEELVQRLQKSSQQPSVATSTDNMEMSATETAFVAPVRTVSAAAATVAVTAVAEPSTPTVTSARGVHRVLESELAVLNDTLVRTRRRLERKAAQLDTVASYCQRLVATSVELHAKQLELKQELSRTRSALAERDAIIAELQLPLSMSQSHVILDIDPDDTLSHGLFVSLAVNVHHLLQRCSAVVSLLPTESWDTENGEYQKHLSQEEASHLLEEVMQLMRTMQRLLQNTDGHIVQMQASLAEKATSGQRLREELAMLERAADRIADMLTEQQSPISKPAATHNGDLSLDEGIAATSDLGVRDEPLSPNLEEHATSMVSLLQSLQSPVQEGSDEIL
eukprot:TRINITY_DN7977_c0_g1_i1.p1 TRINITY_DN7977_c0_g1~~TRINITY_DN7977_c0_g1_i1.p1  ORF type:complete len:744 (-),score=213.19 TRINITY_DN7977_c0_g1_i1:589-2820(-)